MNLMNNPVIAMAAEHSMKSSQMLLSLIELGAMDDENMRKLLELWKTQLEASATCIALILDMNPVPKAAQVLEFRR